MKSILAILTLMASVQAYSSEVALCYNASVTPDKAILATLYLTRPVNGKVKLRSPGASITEIELSLSPNSEVGSEQIAKAIPEKLASNETFQLTATKGSLKLVLAQGVSGHLYLTTQMQEDKTKGEETVLVATSAACP